MATVQFPRTAGVAPGNPFPYNPHGLAPNAGIPAGGSSNTPGAGDEDVRAAVNDRQGREQNYIDFQRALGLTQGIQAAPEDYHGSLSTAGISANWGAGGAGSGNGAASRNPLSIDELLRYGDKLFPQLPALRRSSSSAADSAAFSRAKDIVGKVGRASMDSLRNQFSSRGLQGSGLEGRAMGTLAEKAQGQLSDVARQAAISGYEREGQMDDEEYQAQVRAELAKRDSMLQLVRMAQSGTRLY